MSRPTSSIKAILFDMDGTLTVPWINWPELRAAIGATDGLGIIEFIESLPPDQQSEAEEIVCRFEMDAARQAPANAGMVELFERLDTLPMKRALITNSHRAAMLHVVERYNLTFDLCLSREDGVLKPAPDLLLIALTHFGIGPGEAVFLGDGRYDRLASAAAGVRYVHLSQDATLPEEEETIYALPEFLDMLDGSVGPS